MTYSSCLISVRLCFDTFETCLFVLFNPGEYRAAHVFSIYFMLPYTAVCAALLYHNW